MKYRVTEIFPSAALTVGSVTTTQQIPVNVKDPISALLIEYKVTNKSSLEAQTEHVAANLPTISLVDGSDVLFSLTGKEMHALGYYDNAMEPYSLISNIPSDMQLLGIVYNFGRKLWDTDLALDPSKFKNLYLNVSHNYRLASAAASAEYLRVVALCFDEKKITPQGFLMSKEIDAPTWVANGAKVTTWLPVDYPIRKLMLRGYYATAYPYQVINHIHIDEDNDARVPFDIDTSAWQKIMFSKLPLLKETLQFQVTNSNQALYCTPSFDLVIAGAQISGTTPMIISQYPMNVPAYLQGAATTNGAYIVTGRQPHACIVVPFGDQEDLSDWYETGGIKKLRLLMTGGSAGASATVSVVAQQFRKY